MGAIKPWHLMILLCLATVVLVIGGLVLHALFRRK